MSALTFEKKRDLLFALEKVVAEVGQAILGHQGSKIFDTGDYKGHDSSSIDTFAREQMQAALDRHAPEVEGTIRFELKPIVKSFIEAETHDPLVLIIDEIEGTTNTKRCLASSLGHRPQALISVALSTSESLRDLVIGVVYTLDQGEVFSALRVSEDHFLAFRDQKIIVPSTVITSRGDSRKRILVIGYSNSYRIKKGELEQALYDKGLKVYDGCRASGMDTINLIRNGTDAYVDLRTFWSTKNQKGHEQEAMLQVYDIAGVIPIAEGCGMKVTDAEGKSWQEYNLESSIPLVIARPDIHQLILDTIRPLVDRWKQG